MTTAVRTGGPVWQPLTTGGVAAFARASRGRLVWTGGGVAAILSAVIVWFLATAWFPVITDAIDQLPEGGVIRGGRLEWTGASRVALAGTPFLSVVVDLRGTGELGQVADVQCAFGRMGVTLCSLFGCWTLGYPTRETIPFNRAELGPWWGAWHPVILAGMGGLIWLGQLLIWSLLAWFYAAPVRLLAFYLDRDLGRGGGWRLAAAALMPGALLLAAAIGWYGLGRLALAGLIIFAGLHLVVGWVYLALASARLPRLPRPAAAGQNPFAAPPSGGGSASGPEEEV